MFMDSSGFKLAPTWYYFTSLLTRWFFHSTRLIEKNSQITLSFISLPRGKWRWENGGRQSGAPGRFRHRRSSPHGEAADAKGLSAAVHHGRDATCCQCMRSLLTRPRRRCYSVMAPEKTVAFSWRGSSKSLCVVNDQPVGNPKRKVWWV
jgi:hypothetical protein